MINVNKGCHCVI